MWRRVNQTVGRQHAELTGTPHPMIGLGLAGLQIEQLDARTPHQNKPFGGPIAIAAMVAHTGRKIILVGGPRALDLPRFWVERLGNTGFARSHQLARPQQSIGQQHVDRRVVAFAALTAPQPFAGFGRKHDQFARRCLAAILHTHSGPGLWAEFARPQCREYL